MDVAVAEPRTVSGLFVISFHRSDRLYGSPACDDEGSRLERGTDWVVKRGRYYEIRKTKFGPYHPFHSRVKNNISVRGKDFKIRSSNFPLGVVGVMHLRQICVPAGCSWSVAAARAGAARAMTWTWRRQHRARYPLLANLLGSNCSGSTSNPPPRQSI